MKLLLLVQNEADVAHLDAAARAILNSSITGVWIVFSPAITVNASEAAAKLDGEIAQLKSAERQAADRGDYAAAAGYKQQREGKELDRAKALRDAWKTANAEERQAKTKAIFSPFIEHLKPHGLNVRITSHSDHYDHEQWVAMLNSLSGVWFKEFTPGSFMVAWPGSVETSIKQKITLIPDETPEEPEEVKQARVRVAQSLPEAMRPGVGKSRADELLEMHPMKRKVLARSLGIDTEGKDKEAVVKEILAAEQKPAAPTPALAEY